jgi:hypothetical protein
LGRIDPAAFGDESCANIGELAVVEYAKRGALYVDFVAGFYESFGCCGCDSRAVSKRDFDGGGDIRADLCSSGLVSARRWRVVVMIAVSMNAEEFREDFIASALYGFFYRFVLVRFCSGGSHESNWPTFLKVPLQHSTYVNWMQCSELFDICRRDTRRHTTLHLGLTFNPRL